MTRDVYEKAMAILDKLNSAVDKAIYQLENDTDEDGYGLGQEEGYGLGKQEGIGFA